MDPNFTESIYGWSITKFPHFVLIRLQVWRPQATIVSDWLIFYKSSPLNSLGQMGLNFTGNVYEKSFTKLPHFVQIGQQTWLPWAILVSDWLILQKSSPLKPLGQMEPNYTGNIYWRSFAKFPHFVLIRLQIWSPQAILISDWLKSQKSSLKPLSQMKPNYIGSIYGRSFAKFPHCVSIGQQT